MTGSGVTSSWQTETCSPPRAMRPHKEAYGQVISLPSFEGRFNPVVYLDWELEVEQIFASNNFSDLERVRATTRAFTGFASIWWSVYIKQNIHNKPTIWKDLKAIMRHKFVPPYYRRELLRKLEQLKQGSNTVHAYYQEFKSYMHKCDIEESEDDRKNIFFNGLNDDIRARFHYIPRCIIGMYVRACTFERQIQEDALGDYDDYDGYYSRPCSPPPIVSFAIASSTTTMPPILSVISPSASMTFPSSVPTSFESLQQGNNKGIDDITSHEDDACIVELNKSCVELPVDLSTPSILDNHVTIMKLPMLTHFDMTSNLGDDSASNDLLHDYLVKPIVACPSKKINVYSPLLGWFNDKHCKSLDMNKSFTYICKLSCNTFMSFTYCDDHISLYFTTYESYSYIHVLHVQKLREVRMDDIYIYNMYTLSLLKATFQIKQRRGRLCFQEGEDDEDMATIFTPTTPPKIPSGPITRERAHQLNYKALTFLVNVSNVHVNMILPNVDIFLLLTNEGPSMDKKDEHWSMFKHEDDEDIIVMDMTINSSIFDQEMNSIQRGMIVCCTRSYFTLLLAQEKIETKSLTSWTQIQTAEIYPTSNSLRFYIQTPNWMILFAGDILSRLLSNPIGFTFKFLLSVEILRKRCDPTVESESKSNLIGVASPPHGPKCLVPLRFSFRTPWDVLPLPWPPPFSPI